MRLIHRSPTYIRGLSDNTVIVHCVRNYIPQEMVRKSFLETSLFNDLDGNKNDYLWNECEDGGVDELNTYHHRGTLMRMCHKNCVKNCLVTV